MIAPSLLLRDRCSAAGLATEDWVVHACGVDRALMALPRPRFTAPLRLGFFGSLVPEKGAEVLLMALSALPADAVRVVLRGPKGADPAYEAKLRRLARGRADVHFGGPFRPAELPQAMAEIDVLIVPSLWLENAPFVILEARAAGRPVIASDLGGMRELVRVGVDGFTFPAGDAVALAARLAAFVAAPASLRELSPRPSPSIDEDAAFHRTQYAALLARRTW